MSIVKRAAGREAAAWVEDGMTVGLGTGSTVFFTLMRLAERIRTEGLQVRGVPTSLDTEAKAKEMAIPLVSLAEVQEIDLTIDGADEVDPQFQMIKGGGGALLREKVVASITRRELIVVGRGKIVSRLGSTFNLPVEVVPFARPVVNRALRLLGGEPNLRLGDDAPFLTDNGNEILDTRFPEGIEDPAWMERAILTIPGVVECGLFIDLCHAVVIGEDNGSTETIERGF